MKKRRTIIHNKLKDFMEVILSSGSEVTLHYILRTQAEDSEAQDLAGLFHVVSIWKKSTDTWNLIFNMDSRILES